MIFTRMLGNALRKCLEKDSRVILLGEDIIDPYGGAFKVTRGLSTDFPDRVLPTPISEAAIAGISSGLALAGFRPIAEIMFCDFLSLCFDQILNHITKYSAMYNQQVQCPVIIRTPSGGGRGYGPTHSQSLEKYFIGIPGLRVVAASAYHDPYEAFQHFLTHHDPILYIEHKLLYPSEMSVPIDTYSGHNMITAIHSDDFLPTISLSPVPVTECSVTILAYGYQASIVDNIIQEIAISDEIFAHLLVPAQLSPMNWEPILDSVKKTGRLITVEEGTAGCSWGSEIATVISKECFHELKMPVEVLTSQSSIIPSARHLEKGILVNEQQIKTAIRKVVK